MIDTPYERYADILTPVASIKWIHNQPSILSYAPVSRLSNRRNTRQ